MHSSTNAVSNPYRNWKNFWDHTNFECQYSILLWMMVLLLRRSFISQAPVNNFQAATGFIGIKPTTNRGHMVRAILESIVFRVLQLYWALQREVKNCYTCIRLVGYSKNYIYVNCIADSRRNTYHSRQCWPSSMGIEHAVGIPTL